MGILDDVRQWISDKPWMFAVIGLVLLLSLKFFPPLKIPMDLPWARCIVISILASLLLWSLITPCPSCS